MTDFVALWAWPTEPTSTPFDYTRVSSTYAVVDPIDVATRFDPPVHGCSFADARLAGEWDFARAFAELASSAGEVRVGMTPIEIARRIGYPPRFGSPSDLASAATWIYGYDGSATLLRGSHDFERARIDFAGGRATRIAIAPTPASRTSVDVRSPNDVEPTFDPRPPAGDRDRPR